MTGQCSIRLNGVIASMNEALEEEDSRSKLIELNERISAKAALIAKGRILLLEDDVQCTCNDEVSESGWGEG